MHFVSLDSKWRVHAEWHPQRCNKRWPKEFKTEVINLFCLFTMTRNSFISVFSIWTLKYMLTLKSESYAVLQIPVKQVKMWLLSLLHSGICVLMYSLILTLGLHRETAYYTILYCKQTFFFFLSCQRRGPV